jgi:hypothetical protein
LTVLQVKAHDVEAQAQRTPPAPQAAPHPAPQPVPGPRRVQRRQPVDILGLTTHMVTPLQEKTVEAEVDEYLGEQATQFPSLGYWMVLYFYSQYTIILSY